MKNQLCELFEFCEANRISPNQLYILWCISNKTRPKHTNDFLELRNMVRAEMLSEDYLMTDAGKKIFESANAFQKQKPIAVVSEDLASNVITYLNLFPAGKLPSGKAARANKTDITKSFTWFFANYTYSWDVILSATAYYVDTYEKNKFMYMKNSQYFIRKQVTGANFDSELASYCEIILTDGHKEDTTGLKEKVV